MSLILNPPFTKGGIVFDTQYLVITQHQLKLLS